MGLNDKCLELTISYDISLKLSDTHDIQCYVLTPEPVDGYPYFIHRYNNTSPLLTKWYVPRFVVCFKHQLCHLLHRELR